MQRECRMPSQSHFTPSDNLRPPAARQREAGEEEKPCAVIPSTEDASCALAAYPAGPDAYGAPNSSTPTPGVLSGSNQDVFDSLWAPIRPYSYAPPPASPPAQAAPVAPMWGTSQHHQPASSAPYGDYGGSYHDFYVQHDEFAHYNYGFMSTSQYNNDGVYYSGGSLPGNSPPGLSDTSLVSTAASPQSITDAPGAQAEKSQAVTTAAGTGAVSGPTTAVGRARRRRRTEQQYVAAREGNSSLPATPEGTLAKFPLEILHAVVDGMTLRTFAACLRVSKHMKDVLENHPFYWKYAVVLRNNPTVLKCMATTGIEKFYTIHCLQAFFDWRCVKCGNSGNLIYFPEMCRACDFCLQHDSRFETLVRTAAQNRFRLSDKEIHRLPAAKVQPPSHMVNLVKDGVYVTSRKQGLDRAIRYHGSLEAMRAKVIAADNKKVTAYKERLGNWQKAQDEKFGKGNESVHGPEPKTVSAGPTRRHRSSRPKPPKTSESTSDIHDGEYRKLVSFSVHFIDPSTGQAHLSSTCTHCQEISRNMPVDESTMVFHVFLNRAIPAFLLSDVNYHQCVCQPEYAALQRQVQESIEAQSGNWALMVGSYLGPNL